MNPLNSFALWGPLAVAGVGLPVVIHLLNKSRPKKVQWAAMELLQRIAQKRSRKIKLEDWLLMALRCVALLLAAMAMMRLVVSGGGPLLSESPCEAVLAIDGSYSMNHGQFESRMKLARKRASEIAERLPRGSKVSVVLMGQKPDVLLRHAELDLDKIQRQLETLEAEPVALSLPAAIETIGELLDESDLASKAVYFITDAQFKSWSSLPAATTQQLTSLSDQTTTTIVPVWDGTSNNLGISNLHVVSGVRRRDGFVNLAATITNYGQQPATTSVQLVHNGTTTDVATVGPLQPGGKESVRLGVRLADGGINRFEAVLEPDNLPDDDRCFLAMDVREQLSLLIIGNQTGLEPTGRYLELATRLQRSGYGRGLDARTVDAAAVQASDITSADCIVLANVGDLPDAVAAALKSQVAAGAGLLIYAGDEVDGSLIEQTLGELLPAQWQDTVKPESDQAVRLQVATGGHPISDELARLESHLADVAVQGFHRVKAHDASSVLVSLSTGDPLLITQRVGEGNVALVTTGPARRWSSLPLSPIGPILFHLLLDHVSTGGVNRTAYVGQSLTLPVATSQMGAEPRVTHPSGQTSAPERLAEEGDDVTLALGNASEPGFYELQLNNNGGADAVSVNVDATEGAVQPADFNGLRESLAATGVTIAETSEAAAQVAASRTDLFSYFALGSLLAMIAQAAIAMELTRRKRQTTQSIRTGYGVGVQETKVATSQA